MLVALTLGLATFAGAIVAVASPDGRLFGLPSFPFFLFGVLGVSGAIGDFKTLRAGVLRGAPRLSRHLWRMCMALFITAASFFSIRARVAAILPAPFTYPGAARASGRAGAGGDVLLAVESPLSPKLFGTMAKRRHRPEPHDAGGTYLTDALNQRGHRTVGQAWLLWYCRNCPCFEPIDPPAEVQRT